jgi:hypothetical protein
VLFDVMGLTGERLIVGVPLPAATLEREAERGLTFAQKALT